MTERWRVGTKIGKNLYRITDDHPEGEDIGRMDTLELAAFVVDAVNEHLIAVDRRREREEVPKDA